MSKNLDTDFFEISLEMLCIADAKGFFIKLNPRWSEVLGFSSEELMSKPFLEFVHLDDQEKTVREAGKLYVPGSKHQTVEFRNRYLTQSGNYKWLDWTAQSRDGIIYAAARDITQAVAQTEYLESMGEIVNTGYWHFDLETMTSFWSDQACDIHGEPRGTVVDLSSAINYYAPEERDRIQKLIENSFKTGKKWDVEAKIITAQGDQKWIRSYGQPELKNGQVKALYGIIQDIDKSKNAEIELQNTFRETHKYKTALDAQAIVAITNLQGVITYVNDKFCEISGYSRKELIGKTHRLVNSDYHPSSFFKDMWATIKSGVQWRGLIQNKTKNGNFYWVESSITPITDSNNQIVEYLAIRTDVSTRVELETQVISQKEQLVHSSRLAALGEMAGGVAHEVNNPLAILRASTLVLGKLLHNPEKNLEKIHEGIERIDSTVLRISTIVTGLRSFAREDRSGAYEKVSVKQIVSETLSLCREKFSNHGVTVEVKASSDVEIECNRTQISQVLLNLLNNAYSAIKDMNSRGKVTVTVDSDPQKNQINLSVEDNGPGIPNEIRDKIFEPFFTTKPVGAGTGLGLGISLGICKAHMGSIDFDLDASGAKFVITLPIDQKFQKISKGEVA